MQNFNFSKMFGKVAPGMCRLSMNGIAIKTDGGYKVYDVNKGTLVNCADFVFDVGDDMFFVFPTNTVSKGDLILVDDGPACVISSEDNQIKVFRYKDSMIATIVPESYFFFGNTFFYSKIVSMFGDMSGGNMDVNKIMPFMMMTEMFKGSKDSNSELGKMLPMIMMMNSGINFNTMFGGMFGNTNNAVSTVVTTDGGDK